MIDGMEICNCLNINIGTVMKNPEMLKFVSDHLKTKKLCKNEVKKLPDLLRYVPDQYKTQQMCNKAVLENGGILKSVPDCYKSQEMCGKAVDTHPSAINLFLNAIRLTKCVIKQLIYVFLILILFLIGIKLN